MTTQSRAFPRAPITTVVLALVFPLTGLMAGACGDDDDGAAAKTNAQSMVEIINFQFTPKEITVEAGATVTWVNRDEAAHTVKDQSELGAEESPDLAQGETFSLTYESPGEYPYICGIHNYMTGAVVVEG